MAHPTLHHRLGTQQAVIGVIGLGYVGLPLLLAFAERGFAVVGVDHDANKVQALAAGHSYMHHIAPQRIAAVTQAGRLSVSSDFAALRGCDAVLLCVPTPLDAHREPDLTFVRTSAQCLAPHLAAHQLVVLESTTYPGTTRDVVCTTLEAGGTRRAGVDFYLAFSPERACPGNTAFAFADIPKVVGGLTPNCRAAAVAVYGAVVKKVIPVSSLEAAELTKLLENIFRCVNIALVNELKVLSQAMGIDIWEVIDAAATKPFGFMPFYPGPGLGGHCIPVDPFYLAWRARAFDQPMRFIELAGEINARMPQHIVERIAWALNTHTKAVRCSKILILGVAYKKDIDDMRESPALRIIAALQARGAAVSYHDPFVPRLPQTRTFCIALCSVDLSDTMLRQLDAAVVITDHTGVDYARVVATAPLTVDTRNATRDVAAHRDRIVSA